MADLHPPIFIIGYMASGKTTLGRALARALGRDFIDLDFYIEQRFRKRIPEIFAERGEEGFRDMEARMLREVGEFSGVVVSCGGGTPCHRDNMEYMNARGTTVFLDATIARICYRLSVAKTRRPLLEGIPADRLPAFIESHLAPRLPYYTRAHISIPSDALETRAQIDTAVSALLPLLPG
ncbi:MAG: shikimate kinase [Bacteroides sp.]|nr:shikimate kinase [Bacteroides sp.]